MKNHAQTRLAALATALAGLGTLATPTFAQSTYFTEVNKSVARLGAQNVGFYASFVEPFGQSCQWGNIYITPDRKGIYAQLLTAKLTGRRISRVDYSQPGGNGTQCNAELVEISE